MMITSSDNPLVKPFPQMYPEIFIFDHIRKMMVVDLPLNITEANEWAGNYEFEFLYYLMSNKSINVTAFDFALSIAKSNKIQAKRENKIDKVTSNKFADILKNKKQVSRKKTILKY